MNNGIPLNELEYSYNPDGDYLRIDYPVDMNITGETFFKEVKELILNNQAIVEKLKEKLLYYQNRGWETEVTYTKLLESIYFTVHSKCSGGIS